MRYARDFRRDTILVGILVMAKIALKCSVLHLIQHYASVSIVQVEFIWNECVCIRPSFFPLLSQYNLATSFQNLKKSVFYIMLIPIAYGSHQMRQALLT